MLSLAIAFALAATAPDPKTLDAVEVTARPERLAKPAKAASRLSVVVQNLPVSVDILDQESLRRRGESTITEALENAPGIVPAYSFGVINIAGRGFSGVFNSPTLFDGIRYPGWQVSPRVTLNYAQIEVLRGPAAITAGQGSIAGAINLVPRRADGTQDLRTYSGFGRFGTQTYGLGLGGTLGAVRGRLDISYQGSNERGSFGYAERTSFENFHATGELATAVNDTLTLSLAFDAFDDNAEGYFGSPLIGGALDRRLREANFNITDDYITMQASWLRARAEWSPDDSTAARLVLFANNEDRGYQNTEAYTWTPATQRIRRSDYLRIAHDQEIVGALADIRHTHTLFGLPHEFVVGLQFDRNVHDRFSDSPFRFVDSVDLFPTTFGAYRSLDSFGLRTQTDIEQSSALLDSAIDLTDNWKLISGWRFDQSRVDSLNAPSAVRFDKRYSAPSWRVGAVYADGETSWYGSFATSSEPPAQITTLGQANASFDLTDGEQIELGFKHAADWGDATLAIYDLSRTNILSRDPADANRLIQIGKQTARGIEASWRWSVAETVSIEGHASVLNAEYARFSERVGTTLVSRAGNLPPGVPERMATLWLHWQVFDELGFSLGSRAVGRSSGDNANTVWLPGYATIDLNLRYTHPWGTFGARVRNAADRLYATRPYNAANQFMLGEPRWYEVSWQRRF